MKRFIPLFFLLAALAIAGLSLFGADGLPKLKGLHKSLAVQQEMNYELGAKVRSLKQEVVGIKNSNRELEKAARNELGMARPDEQIFIFDNKASE